MAQSNEKNPVDKAQKNGKPVEKKTKKTDKNKKPNIFVRMGRKIKETFLELKRVTWPSFGKTLKSTGVVLAIVVIFTVITTAINMGFGELLKLITNIGG